jgi:signal peptidase I
MPEIRKEKPIIKEKTLINKKKLITIAIIILAVIIVIVFLLNKNTKEDLVINQCYTEVQRVIDGTSMSPLLKNGQTVISQENFYDCNEIKSGDVVGIHFKTREEDFIKRVVGVPGDSLTCDDSNYLYINGKKVVNSAGQNYKLNSKAKTLLFAPLVDNKIPKNGYLVLGDDVSSDSFDSRQYGFVDDDHIISKIKY